MNTAADFENFRKETLWKERSLPYQFNIPFKILICLISGLLFGFAMQRGSVTDPGVIQNQMLFKQFTMIKFFLTALSTSMFTMSILSMLPSTYQAFFVASNEYFNKSSGQNIKSSIIGGALMGSGMVLAGSCPTSVFPQMGSLVPNSSFMFMGSVLAVMTFLILKRRIDSYFKIQLSETKNPWTKSPYFPQSLPLAAMFGALVCAFETLIPFHIDSNLPITKVTSLSSHPWPPYICGIIVGMLQIPLILVVQKTLSGSSSLVVGLSQLFVGPWKRLSPYASKFQNTLFSTWWQVVYVAGAILGSFLSASLSGTLEKGHIVNPYQAFLGGFLMHMGARIGGGCTSNHGLTGIGLLSISSFIMIISTFSSGIILAFILKLFGSL